MQSVLVWCTYPEEWEKQIEEPSLSDRWSSSPLHVFFSVGLIGLSLSYVIQLPGYMGWCFKMYAKAEVELVSVERLVEFMCTDHEPVCAPESLARLYVCGAL